METRAILRGARMSAQKGRVVADLLGARDLDVWNGVVERSRSTTVTDLVERALAEEGERWLVRVAENAPGPVAAIEGGPLGVRPRGWVAVVDESSRLWRRVESARDRLDWAALVIGDGVTQVAEMAPARRRRLLAGLARRALAEGAP